MKRSRHSISIFPDDIEGDKNLARCSTEAKWFWFRLFMHMGTKSPIYGKLVVDEVGTAPTNSEIARMFSMNTNRVTSLLTQLLTHGVASRDPGGVIYCRRQVREAELSEKRSKASGDRWSGVKQKFHEEPCKPDAKDGEEEALLDLNASEESPERNSLPVVPSSAPTAELAIELWRELCVPAGCTDVRKLTDRRRAHVLARLREREPDGSRRDVEWLRRYLTTIASAPFCTGQGPTGWVADFDFAFRSEDVVARVFEGKYSRVNSSAQQPARKKSQEEMLFDRALAERDREQREGDVSNAKRAEKQPTVIDITRRRP